jgi:hypothetical protein
LQLKRAKSRSQHTLIPKSLTDRRLSLPARRYACTRLSSHLQKNSHGRPAGGFIARHFTANLARSKRPAARFTCSGHYVPAGQFYVGATAGCPASRIRMKLLRWKITRSTPPLSLLPLLVTFLFNGCATPGARLDHDTRAGRGVACARACAPFAAMSALPFDRSNEPPREQARLDLLPQYIQGLGWTKLTNDYPPTDHALRRALLCKRSRSSASKRAHGFRHESRRGD